MPRRQQDAKNHLEARPKGRASSFVGNSQHSIVVAFGKALKDKRTRQGMTQTDVSKLTGIDRSFISEVENGRRNISLERAEALASAVGSSLLELLQSKEMG